MSFQCRHNDIWLAEFVKLCHVPLYTFLWSTLIEENVNWLIENWDFRINCHIWHARLAKFSYPLFYVDGSSLALYMVLRCLFLKETLTMYILIPMSLTNYSFYNAHDFFKYGVLLGLLNCLTTWMGIVRRQFLDPLNNWLNLGN